MQILAHIGRRQFAVAGEMRGGRDQGAVLSKGAKRFMALPKTQQCDCALSASERMEGVVYSPAQYRNELEKRQPKVIEGWILQHIV